MTMRARTWAAAMAVVLVAGCSKGDVGKDTAATVAGEKITTAELETELKAAGVKKPEDPAIQRAALEEIIARKLLAKAARADKLDRTPEALAAKAVVEEGFNANLDRRATVAKVAEPTPAEVSAFVQSHPEMFAQRTGYLLDQLLVPAQGDPGLLAALKPTKTLEDVMRILDERKVPYRRGAQSMDTLRADPQLSIALAKLPPGEPFLLPDPAGFTVSRVRDKRVQPLTGPAAEAVAKELLLAERRTKALKARLEELRKDKVAYGPAFAPKEKAAAAAK
jgi:peptidyl-prolyl cis-trans isomerase C